MTADQTSRHTLKDTLPIEGKCPAGPIEGKCPPAYQPSS